MKVLKRHQRNLETVLNKTANVVNELGLETDLSSILAPSNESNAANSSAPALNSSGAAPASSSSQPLPALSDKNNASNLVNNATSSPAVVAVAGAEPAALSNAEIVISENKFILPTTKEDEIINKIQEKTKLGEDKIKMAIRFRHKEAEEEEYAYEEPLEAARSKTQIVQQAVRQDYMTKVNGSVIIRIG